MERECNKLTRICNNNTLMQFYFFLNTIRFRKRRLALCDDSTIQSIGMLSQVLLRWLVCCTKICAQSNAFEQTTFIPIGQIEH